MSMGLYYKVNKINSCHTTNLRLYCVTSSIPFSPTRSRPTNPVQSQKPANSTAHSNLFGTTLTAHPKLSTSFTTSTMISMKKPKPPWLEKWNKNNVNNKISNGSRSLLKSGNKPESDSSPSKKTGKLYNVWPAPDKTPNPTKTLVSVQSRSSPPFHTTTPNPPNTNPWFLPICRLKFLYASQTLFWKTSKKLIW